MGSLLPSETTVLQVPTPEQQSPYRPLDKNSRQIRVASLLPGYWDDQISCELSIICLDDTESSYEALSYVWAQELGTRVIVLDGCEHQVTTNLFLALRRLRKRTSHRVIWVDALCINQHDDQEKSHQVGIMGHVYRNCLRVVVWLGDYGNDPETLWDTMTVDDSKGFPWYGANQAQLEDKFDHGWNAYEFIYEMSLDKHLDELGIWSNPRKFSAFCSLTKLPWWERIWVIQELVLSQEVLVVYGSIHAPWEMFAAAANMFYKHGGQCCTQYMAFNKIDGELWSYIKDFSDSCIRINYVRTQIHDGEKFHIWNLLWRFQGRKTTDARDMIYALTGFVAQDRDSVQPDYGLNKQEVYQNLVMTDLLRGGKLNTLFGQRNSQSTLPSWLYDWSMPIDDSIQSWEAVRLQNYHYAASLDWKADFHLGSKSSLSLDGISLGSIVNIGPKMLVNCSGREFIATAKSWHEMARKFYRPLPELPAEEYVGGGAWNQAFWRTIIAGIDPETKSQVAEEERLSVIGGTFRLWWFHFPTRNAARIIQTASLTAFHKTVQQATHGRTFFMTQNGYMGLGNAQIGDEVWILLGGDLPFILRPSTDASSHTMIGDCYVQGIMNGEAMIDLETKRRTAVLR